MNELAVAVNLVYRLVYLHAGALQLNLDQRKAVDENRHIVTVLVRNVVLVVLVHRDLVRHLVDVAVGIGAEEIQIHGPTVIQRQDVLVAQNLRRFINTVVVHVNHHTTELRVREGGFPLRLNQLGRIERRELLAEIRHNVVVVRHIDELIANALKPVYEQVLDIVF